MIKMKYLLVFSLLVVHFSCKKAHPKVEDYFPKVQLSVTENQDGSIFLKANITDEGSSQIEILGFCYSDSPDFDITSNQIAILDLSNFTTTLPVGFDPNKTYYFKAFASNSYGSSESNIVEVSNIESEPVIANCIQTTNSYDANLAGVITSFDTAINVNGEVVYNCFGTNNAELGFYFKTPPVTGIYKTTSNYTTQGEVYISGTIGFNTFEVKPNASVYVNRLSNTQFSIEVCDAVIRVNNIDKPFKVKIVRNY